LFYQFARIVRSEPTALFAMQPGQPVTYASRSSQQVGSPTRLVQVGQPLSPGSHPRRVSSGSANVPVNMSVRPTGSLQAPPSPTGSFKQPSKAESPNRIVFNAQAVRRVAAAPAVAVSNLRERAHSASEKVQGNMIAPVAKRVRETRSRVERARISIFLYVHHVAGCAKGAVAETIQQIKTKGVRAWAVDTARATPARARAAAAAAKQNMSQLAIAARDMAKDKSFQATAVSAAGGAVTLGATGGVTGLATGTAIGAAVGLPAALFTFGLSIPISAAIGGTCGLFTGAAAGGAAGAVGGGAVGYQAYQKRDQISSAVSSGRQQISKVATKIMSSVSSSAALAKEKAGASAEFVGDRASTLRSRFAVCRN